MNIIQQLEAEQAAKIAAKRTLPDFSPGDTVRVNVRVVEGTRTRVQAYEGVCIARSGAGLNESFTVRKISYGEGVERVFPVFSPLVEGVEIVRRGKVRRAKLYYLRDLRGKKARIVENTNVRARKLNDGERAAAAHAEKARLEAEKVAAAQALAAGRLLPRPLLHEAKLPKAEATLKLLPLRKAPASRISRKALSGDKSRAASQDAAFFIDSSGSSSAGHAPASSSLRPCSTSDAKLALWSVPFEARRRGSA